MRQAEPRCGRGCRDEPVLAGVEMRRPGAVAAGGANRLMCRLRDCEAVLRMGGTSARQSQPVDVPVEGLRSRALTG